MTKQAFAMVALMISVAAFVFAQGPDQEISRRRERADGIRRRQQEFYRQRAYPSDRIPPGARATAVAEMEHMIAAERKLRGTMITGPAWTLIGPRPTNTLAEYGPGGAGLPYAAGRVAALAVDPRDANVAYLGAAGGGVWKTTDGGQNWQPLTDDQPSLASGSIAIAPSDPDTVYVGTGEDNNSGDSYYGAGVLKSTDGGATWTQLAGPFVGPFSSSRTSGGGARIAALAVHPTDPNTVLAAVDRFPAAASGIYRTSDGGQTWTLVQGGAVGTEVIFNPTDPTIAYAALGTSSGNSLNGVYKSTDSGMTWKASGGRNPTALPTASVGRIEIALAPSNPNILYAGIQNSGTLFGTLLGMFKSTDAGQTWTQVFAPDYCTPQCSYNNVIRVHPKNPNVVVAAGLPPWRSTNGGLTWSNIAVGPSGFAAHTDHHALAFSNDGRLYDGNDGGAFSTSDVTAVSPTWANLNATLAITEFTSNVSIHPSDPNIAYAGTQDNSTQMYTGNLAWDQVTPGDGGRTAIDPAIPSIWYASFNGITPLKFNGLTSVSSYLFYIFTDSYPYLRNGIATTDRSQFYPPMVMDPSNPLRLYYGTQRLYQSSDGAGTWTAISPDLTASNTGTITAIAVSPSFPGAVAVGTNTGKVQVTNTGLQSGSVEWIDRSTGLPGRSVAQVAFDPTTVTTVYAILSGFSGFLPNDSAGHVFKSTDFGETWNDISGNLPNIPVNDIVVDPDQPNVLYIATDIGVFLSSDGGMTWSTLSNGLPRVLVQGLNLHRPSRTLRAVTYGRSMWDLSVPLAGSSSAPQIRALSPASVNANTNPMTIALTGSNFTLTSVVRWNGSDRPTSYGSASTLHVTLPASDLGQPGRATILVFNPVTGGGLSNSVNVPVGPAPSATAGGLTSAANPALAGTLVPGGIHSIYGSGLAPGTVSAGTPPLPNTLGGITVEINTIPAPLFYVSPTQINFQAPWDLEGHSSATLTVINGTLKSAPLPVNVAAAAPSLFSIDASGRGQGAILIAGPEVLAAPDGKFSSSRPARHGEFIEIYCTGLGPVSRIQASGTPKPPTTPPAITQTPVVTVGGVPAVVTFSGLAPGGVGLYQVNVQVPDGTPAGDAVPVIVTIGGASSNTVTLAVSP